MRAFRALGVKARKRFARRRSRASRSERTNGMAATLKQLTDFLVNLGIEQIAHTQKNYLGHLINVYKLLQSSGYEEDICRAGLFHSIYGTEKFQGFKLPLESREELIELIGSRAERLAYWNCLMDRGSLDELLVQSHEPFLLRNRE